MIYVPVALLLDPCLPLSAKLVWMARRLHPSAGPSELVVQTGLTSKTVRRGLALIKAVSHPVGRKAAIPSALLADASVGVPAKVLYGLLQIVPNYRGHRGHFTFSSLQALTGFGLTALRRAVQQLVDARWIQISRENRLKPIFFKLGSPDLIRVLAMAALTRRRINRADHHGEAIMQEFLTLLIDDNRFTDNARPWFLVNPETGERLELDRYYEAGVGFEFNGPQHSRETKRFTQAQVEAQRKRDIYKAGLCVYGGVHLVVIEGEDLTLPAMLRKIHNCLPLRNRTGYGPVIQVLEEESLEYRRSVSAITKPTQSPRQSVVVS